MQPEELTKIYNRRFSDTASYRNKVWMILCDSFFANYVKSTDAILDLGCGYGEFINNIQAGQKWGMDLNPVSKSKLSKDIVFLEQDCSHEWPLEEGKLDIIFTSNFFEHLPDKRCLDKTLQQCFKSLKSGGMLIAMGPNMKYLSGAYWNFYDHHVILTELSLSEALEIQGFKIKELFSKFLPYTLVDTKPVPKYFVKIYLKIKLLWRFKGKQFLVIAQKP